MRLYSLKLPRSGNDGRDYASALQAFEAFALDVAGGCTVGASQQGSWKDGATVYRDRVVPFEVACDPATFGQLVARAFDLFPDQLAIFASCGAEAMNLERPSPANDNVAPYEDAVKVADRLRAVSNGFQRASWAVDAALREIRVRRAEGQPTAEAEERLAAALRTAQAILPHAPASSVSVAA